MRPVISLITLLMMLSQLPAAAQGPRSSRQDQDVMNYRLSMERLHKLIAVQRALNAANAKDPEVFEKIDQENQAMAKKNGGPLTVAQRVTILERYPAAQRAFTSAGVTARDYMLTGEAMGAAYTALEVKNKRLSPEAAPPPTAASKANVALLEKNQAEWEKILEELDQLSDELLAQ